RAAVMLRLDHETGLVCKAAIGIRRLDKAGLISDRPGHRKVKLAIANPHHVVDAEAPAAPQDTSHLRKEFPLVADVHADMDHGRRIEAVSVERKGKRA